MYLRRSGLRIFGTPLAAILYLVIKSWTNVAEMYFYLIRGPLKCKFGYQKCIYIAGLEIEISRKLYLMYGHGGYLEK